MNLEKISGLRTINPTKSLADPEFTAKAIMECLLNNDPEGVMEVISNYLEAVDTLTLRKATKLHRSTMYSALKHRNPTIKTLAKIMHSPKKTTARRSPKGISSGSGGYVGKGQIAASGKRP